MSEWKMEPTSLTTVLTNTGKAYDALLDVVTEKKVTPIVEIKQDRAPGDLVIGKGSTVGGNVFLMESVPPNSFVTGKHPELHIKTSKDKQ